MEMLSLVLSVTLIHLLAVVSPGPDFVVAVRNSLAYSRSIGIWTAVGFGLGIAVHVFYSIAGLAVIISQSEVLFRSITVVGALYLIYIGVMSFYSSAEQSSEIHQSHEKKTITAFQAVKIGFITNVFNPKATLFFLSLFTLVISPETSTPVLLLLSGIMILNTMIWFSLVAAIFTHSSVRKKFYSYQSVFNKLFGIILVLFALKILFF